MKLEVLTVALEAIEHLQPIVARIRRHDRKLANQITDAAESSPQCSRFESQAPSGRRPGFRARQSAVWSTQNSHTEQPAVALCARFSTSAKVRTTTRAHARVASKVLREALTRSALACWPQSAGSTYQNVKPARLSRTTTAS